MTISIDNDGELYSWIRREREKRGLSQSKLSQLTGIAQVHLSAWEHKKSAPKPDQHSVVVEAFHRFDEMVESGAIGDFLRKTRWSKDFSGSRKVNRTRRNVITLEECAQYASSIMHDDRSPQRFSRIQKNTAKFKGVALFAGCGGMAMGFSHAGVFIAGHVEIEDAMRAVFQSNFHNSRCLASDINELSDNLLKQLSSGDLSDVDVVFGGPPCQGFSLTGKRDVYDPRNQLYKQFARVVAKIRPKTFVLENVRLLMSMKTPTGELLVDDLVDTFRELSYNVNFGQLNARDFGVAQSRARYFAIGVDAVRFPSSIPTLPKATHGASKGDLFDLGQNGIATLRDAIGDLRELESGDADPDDPLHFAVSHPSHVIEMLKDVPEGCTAHDNLDPNLRPKSGYNTTYKRLRWDEPSSTISTTFGMISGSRNVHPSATRSLTIREALRIQSFPDDFLVFGSVGGIRTMIGNAVPPELAYAVASHVLQLVD